MNDGRLCRHAAFRHGAQLAHRQFRSHRDAAVGGVEPRQHRPGVFDEHTVGAAVQKHQTLAVSLSRHAHLDCLGVRADEAQPHARGQLAEGAFAEFFK